MTDSRVILRSAMLETGVTQSALARISGVRQPTISQVLSGTVGISDEQLERLLACLGYRLRVIRDAVPPDLTRSERRSWRLHRQLSSHLSEETLPSFRRHGLRNLRRLRATVRGEPHGENLRAWRRLLADGDVIALHRVLTGLDRHSIEMREVSPLSGLLPEHERLALVSEAS